MIWFNPVFQHFLKFNIYEWIALGFVKNRKLARNLSAGTHACGAVCLNALDILYPTLYTYYILYYIYYVRYYILYYILYYIYYFLCYIYYILYYILYPILYAIDNIL